MKFSRVFIVVGKEIRDALRDRRSLFAVVFGTLIGPLLIAFLLNRIANQQRGALEIKVPVVGREYAPLLIDWLEQQSGVEITKGPSDAEAAVRESNLDFVLIIAKEFPQKFRESRPALVQVVSDSTRQSTRAKVQRLHSLLSRFSAETGSLRLVARGISPAVASTLNIEDIEVSSAQQRAAQVFNMIPMFLVLAAFVGGMQIATDSTAGERERGSLEPLLVNPIPRFELVAGKWMAAVSAAAISMSVTLVITSTILLSLPLEDLGFRFRFSAFDAILLLATTLPIALIAPALQMYLASFAKSFKEAQSYMGYLILLPMLPGMAAAFYPMSGRPWLAPIPIVGQYALATDIMGGNPPAPIYLFLAAVTATAFAATFVFLTARLFSNEKIILSR